MCLHANRLSSKVHEVVAPSELHLFILDEIGEHSLCQLAFRASTHNGARCSRRSAVVDQVIGEDGGNCKEDSAS